MIAFLRRLLGMKPARPPRQTAQIRTMPREIWEPTWTTVYVLEPAADGTRRFYWPGPCGFVFSEHASFIEEIK